MNNYTPTMGSLFSGFGGFELPAEWHGAKCLWQSEIEPWPVRLLAHRFPDAIQLGDITKINGAEIPPVDFITFGSPCQDMSVAGKREGIEGSRSVLFYEATRIIREMREATNGEYPHFAIWENVPGSLTSHNGGDFRAVLEEITEAEIPMPNSGRWADSGMVRGTTADISWRVLDAQYWGVPQRRKRVVLVADYKTQRSAEILFIPESLSRHPSQSGQQGQGTAGTFALDIGETGIRLCGVPLNCRPENMYELDEKSSTLCNGTNPGHHNGVLQPKPIELKIGSFYPQMKAESQCYNENGISNTLVNGTNPGFHNGVVVPQIFVALTDGKAYELGALSRGQGGQRVWDVCPTLREKMGDNLPAIIVLQDKSIGRKESNTGNGLGVTENGPCYTITSTDVHGVLAPIIVLNERQHALTVGEDIANTLTATDYKGTQVAFIPIMIENHPNDSRVKIDDSGNCQTLTGRMGTGGGNVPLTMIPIFAIDRAAFNQGINAQYDISIQDNGTMQTLVAKGPNAVGVPTEITLGELTAYIEYIVRRLMPGECAELQGFPFDWHEGVTDEKGNEMKDSPAYKGYGNAVATVVAEYPITNIIKILREEHEQCEN